MNDAPTLDLPLSFTFTEDETLIDDFSVYADDIEGNPLTLSVTGNTNVTVDISGFTVTLGSIQDWNGMETLTFTVDDLQLSLIHI